MRAARTRELRASCNRSSAHLLFVGVHTIISPLAAAFREVKQPLRFACTVCVRAGRKGAPGARPWASACGAIPAPQWRARTQICVQLPMKMVSVACLNSYEAGRTRRKRRWRERALMGTQTQRATDGTEDAQLHRHACTRRLWRTVHLGPSFRERLLPGRSRVPRALSSMRAGLRNCAAARTRPPVMPAADSRRICCGS